MTKNAEQYPAELELRILKVLWREGRQRVRDVRRLLRRAWRDPYLLDAAYHRDVVMRVSCGYGIVVTVEAD